jgi:translation initiation factor 1
MMQDNNERPVVWTSDRGKIDRCKRCGQPLDQCRCGQRGAPAPHGDGWVRLAREKAGRGGKIVTLVRGVPGDDAELVRLAQELKRLCGAGGTVRDGVIELQGEHREKVQAHLTRLGYRVKIAGG